VVTKNKYFALLLMKMKEKFENGLQKYQNPDIVTGRD